MNGFEITSVVILSVTAIIAVMGWLRDRDKDARAQGAITSSIENLEKNMNTGFRAVYRRIDDYKEQLTTCRKEETSRIERLEGRMDDIKGG